ncbi:MAG: molybdopterin-dependent oxidoreductase [Thermaerobacter sp.]|nr:molybdopterin-dependent oxidoreductase [Thermaerobacter sp.]
MGRTFFARHWRHSALLIALLLTGFGLFLPSMRVALGPLLPVAQFLHTYGGIAYGAGLLIASLRLFPWPPNGAKNQHRFAFALAAVLVLSGLGLLFGTGSTRDVATLVHAASAAGLVIWLAVHLWRERPRRVEISAPGLTRRAVLRWGAGSLLALPALYALPGVLRLLGGGIWRGGPKSAFSEAAGALPGFVPYTVVGGYPKIPRESWRLHFSGLPHAPANIGWPELAAMPQIARSIDFTCVTGWSVAGVVFRGVDLLWLLHRYGWDPERDAWVAFSSGDGVYTDGLTAAQIRQYKPLLASEIDGVPLPQSQGAPVRLVVPGMYGYKSVKWLTGIAAVEHVVLGYWEDRGYPEDARIGTYTGL